MNSKEMEQIIIERYKQDEDTMILVFAQWCVNHGLDAVELYSRAYPQQGGNPRLLEAIPLTAPKEEAGDIDDATVLQVLSLFGNEELAFVVSEEIDRRPRKNR
ncbi:hypothetical protein [Paenibacillus sp. JDR-2]|uniref:hypothetical protein n=1 Tax=Paenibacillus sp. (strain JDR-2) TaxID=324057 RepID=UPI000166BC31|nr:hypothetical protein [Paenibacillus sp. JDR-2]ACT01937.1 conserved hypothetical protein [Paenibacillus sp. JDR-2]